MKFPADDVGGVVAVPPGGVQSASSGLAVGLVSDDSGFLRELEQTLTGHGFKVSVLSPTAAFFRECVPAGLVCVVMDLSSHGTSPSELQKHLPDCVEELPVIFLSGQMNTPSGVTAVKSVAVHFSGKVSGISKLLSALQSAVTESVSLVWAQELASIRERFASLTPREMEVFLHVIAGKLNKQIASDLGISLQTVKIHRMRITEKSGLVSVAELARAACLAGYQPASWR